MIGFEIFYFSLAPDLLGFGQSVPLGLDLIQYVRGGFGSSIVCLHCPGCSLLSFRVTVKCVHKSNHSSHQSAHCCCHQYNGVGSQSRVPKPCGSCCCFGEDVASSLYGIFSSYRFRLGESLVDANQLNQVRCSSISGFGLGESCLERRQRGKSRDDGYHLRHGSIELLVLAPQYLSGCGPKAPYGSQS